MKTKMQGRAAVLGWDWGAGGRRGDQETAVDDTRGEECRQREKQRRASGKSVAEGRNSRDGGTLVKPPFLSESTHASLTMAGTLVPGLGPTH